MRCVVVTGVSSGIGAATVQALLDKGMTVFGSVRTAHDAKVLEGRFGSRFHPLVFDVTDQLAIRSAMEIVREHLAGQPLFGLVNNAGVTSVGPLAHADLDEFRHTLEVNTVGLLAVTQIFLPLLRSEHLRPGRIVNLSSVGGRLVSPFAATYQATKHAVEALSDGLRRELAIYGIDVVVIQPGSTQSAIWDKTEQSRDTFIATDYGRSFQAFIDMFSKLGRAGYPASKVGAVIATALTVRRPKVRYPVVKQRFVNWTIPTILPDRILDAAMARVFGLRAGEHRRKDRL